MNGMNIEDIVNLLSGGTIVNPNNYLMLGEEGKSIIPSSQNTLLFDKKDPCISLYFFTFGLSITIKNTQSGRINNLSESAQERHFMNIVVDAEYAAILADIFSKKTVCKAQIIIVSHQYDAKDTHIDTCKYIFDNFTIISIKFFGKAKTSSSDSNSLVVMTAIYDSVTIKQRDNLLDPANSSAGIRAAKIKPFEENKG